MRPDALSLLANRLPLRALLAAAIAVAVAGVAGAIATRGRTAGWWDDVHWTAASAAAALLGLDALRARSGEPIEGPLRWLAAGLLFYLLGQVLWDLEDVAGWMPFPAPSDACFLLEGPCLFMGLMRLARGQLADAEWLTARLDAASLTLASFTAAMALMLPAGPGASWFQMLALGGYPLGLIAPASLGLILLLTRRARLELSSVLLLGTTAMLALLWVLWNLAFLENRVVSGGTMGLLFSVAVVAMGAGVRVFALHPREDERWDVVCEGVLRLLPLFIVVLASAGIIVASLPGMDQRAGLVTAAGGGVVIVLAAARQSLLLKERQRLVQAERLLRQRESELESRVAQRTHELDVATQAAQAANLAKSQFLANMSHEIRTPLNSVIGLAHLALAECADERQRGYLARIQLSGRHLLRLIDDVLDMSRIEAGRLELEAAPFRFATVIESVRAAVGQGAAEKGVALSFDVSAAADRWWRGDALRLGQVLINLVANAVKFTDSGSVVVTVDVASASEESALVRLEVRDTGIGIAPEAMGRLFAPFHQADNSTRRRFGGTGLGLAICGELVALMGGEIGVESEPGRGSRFHVTLSLPVAAGPVADPVADGRAAAAPASSLRGVRVLLAEDNEVNQLVATGMLRHAGCEVAVAGTGGEVLRLLEERPFDVVLMDVQMPDLDGLEVTRRLRERPALRRLPVVAMTANAREQDRLDCLAAGMDDFLTKPVDPDRLYEAVARWGRGRRDAEAARPS